MTPKRFPQHDATLEFLQLSLTQYSPRTVQHVDVLICIMESTRECKTRVLNCFDPFSMSAPSQQLNTPKTDSARLPFRVR